MTSCIYLSGLVFSLNANCMCVCMYVCICVWVKTYKGVRIKLYNLTESTYDNTFSLATYIFLCISSKTIISYMLTTVFSYLGFLLISSVMALLAWIIHMNLSNFHCDLQIYTWFISKCTMPLVCHFYIENKAANSWNNWCHKKQRHLPYFFTWISTFIFHLVLDSALLIYPWETTELSICT